MELFKADANSDTWKAYVDYVDEITVDGFFNIIHCSLQYFLENTDVSRANQDVLFEAKLELQVNIYHRKSESQIAAYIHTGICHSVTV